MWRIQTFPDSFVFKYQNLNDGYKMVRNTVPVLLAYKIAKELKNNNMIVKNNYRLHENDIGSTALQIISLRAEIEREKFHLAENKKDIPAKRALLEKIAKEKRFFQYLKKRNPEIYEKLKKELK